MTVVTRFAPSPTGYLHLGGARTALFNWLYARHHNGKFLLRIEDTDRLRSTNDAINAITEGIKWLGLTWNGQPISQYSRAQRHYEVAQNLLKSGHAYLCYCTPEELKIAREKAKKEGKIIRYNRYWRDRSPKEAPIGVKPVVRLKAPKTGITTVNDTVQGTVSVQNSELDDMILLRADKSPTYMLAVVVDDHDMGITHVIRGDDHFTNTFRQILIYNALKWDLPSFSHIPLIYGPDGTKLSKRHGAIGLGEWKEKGFLPEAMRNYLLKLGWGHGDDEIISDEQAISWFDIKNANKAPARFDIKKLTSLNAHYIRQQSPKNLVQLIMPTVKKLTKNKMLPHTPERIQNGMESLKERAKTLNELAENALVYATPSPLSFDSTTKKHLNNEAKSYLKELIKQYEIVENCAWNREKTHAIARNIADNFQIKLGKIAQPLRASITGKTISPPIFEVMELLGKEECMCRLNYVLQTDESNIM